MAHHKDAIKRARQSEEQRLRNRHFRTRMRTQIKKLRAAIEAGDHAAAESMFPETVSIIQRVAQKGIIHARNASRHISRLHQAVNGLKASE